MPSGGVTCKMGIPHSSVAQAIIEGAHASVKHLLLQQKGGMGHATLAERLQKTLYVFNFLNCSLIDPNSPNARHFGNNSQLEVKQKSPVLIKGPETGKIMGPYPLVTWGRGFACIATENSPRWIPAKMSDPSENPCIPLLRTLITLALPPAAPASLSQTTESRSTESLQPSEPAST